MLLWIDGFDNFGATDAPSPAGILARKYSFAVGESSMQIVAGRLGGYALNWCDSTFFLCPVFLTTHDTLVVGFAFQYTDITDETLFFMVCKMVFHSVFR